MLILLVESAFFAALAPPLIAGDAREASVSADCASTGDFAAASTPPLTAGDARKASTSADCASAGDFDAASSDCAARNMFMTELARDRVDP